MSGWRSTFPSERMYSNSKFGCMSVAAQDLLIRFYSRCDKWGRGPAHRLLLKQQLMLPSDHDIEGALTDIILNGFVRVYEVDSCTYYQIDRFDEDALKDMIRKRGVSQYPAEPNRIETSKTTVRIATPLQIGEGVKMHSVAPPRGKNTVYAETQGKKTTVYADTVSLETPLENDPVFFDSTLTPLNTALDKGQAKGRPGADEGQAEGRLRAGLDVEVDLALTAEPKKVSLVLPPHADSRPHTHTHAHEREAAEQTKAEPPVEPAPTPQPEIPKTVPERPQERILPSQSALALDLRHEMPPVARTAVPWPSPECEEAAHDWYDKLKRLRPTGHGCDWESVKQVAIEFSDVFAVEAVYMTEGSRGWGPREDALRWLRRGCSMRRTNPVDAAMRAASATAKAGQAPVQQPTQGISSAPCDPNRLGPKADEGPWVQWLRPDGMSSDQMRALPRAVSAWWAIGGPDGKSWERHRDGVKPAKRVVDDETMMAYYCTKHKCTVEAIMAAEAQAAEAVKEYASKAGQNPMLSSMAAMAARKAGGVR